MKRCCLALIAAGAAMSTAATTQEQSVKLAPIAADEALSEFQRVCLRSFPNAGKVKNAVGQSPLHYEAADAGTGRQWRSKSTVVGLNAKGSKASRCGFDAMLTEKIEPGVLAGMVQTRLEREFGHRPSYRQVGQAIVWEWGYGTTTHKLTIDFTSADRQLALELRSEAA